MVGRMQIGSVTIEGISGGSLLAPRRIHVQQVRSGLATAFHFLDEEGMLPIEMGGLSSGAVTVSH